MKTLSVLLGLALLILAGCGRAQMNTVIRHEWADPHTGYRVSAETTMTWQR